MYYVQLFKLSAIHFTFLIMQGVPLLVKMEVHAVLVCVYVLLSTLGRIANSSIPPPIAVSTNVKSKLHG